MDDIARPCLLFRKITGPEALGFASQAIADWIVEETRRLQAV
jgi:hypothetical protein